MYQTKSRSIVTVESLHEGRDVALALVPCGLRGVLLVRTGDGYFGVCPVVIDGGEVTKVLGCTRVRAEDVGRFEEAITTARHAFEKGGS